MKIINRRIKRLKGIVLAIDIGEDGDIAWYRKRRQNRRFASIGFYGGGWFSARHLDFYKENLQTLKIKKRDKKKKRRPSKVRFYFNRK